MHYMHKYILKIYKFILLLELSKAIIENNFGGRSFPSLGYQLDKRLSNKKFVLHLIKFCEHRVRIFASSLQLRLWSLITQ